MRDLVQRLTEMRQVHVPLGDLPPSLRAALKRVEYRAADVAVVPQDSVVPNPYAGEGQRGFVLVVDIASGKARDLEGGWGGARPDDPREIDLASKPVRIPPGGAVIVGTQGHPRTMATVYVHPDALAPLLPSGAEVTPREQMILRTVRSLISSARKEVFDHERVQPAEVDALVQRKLLKRSKSGALSITTAGKNVAEGREETMRDILRKLEEAQGEDLLGQQAFAKMLDNLRRLGGASAKMRPVEEVDLAIATLNAVYAYLERAWGMEDNADRFLDGLKGVMKDLRVLGGVLKKGGRA